MTADELATVLETLKDQPLVPAVIAASILGVLVLRHLNRKPPRPSRPRPQKRPRKKKR